MSQIKIDPRRTYKLTGGGLLRGIRFEPSYFCRSVHGKLQKLKPDGSKFDPNESLRYKLTDFVNFETSWISGDLMIEHEAKKTPNLATLQEKCRGNQDYNHPLKREVLNISRCEHLYIIFESPVNLELNYRVSFDCIGFSQGMGLERFDGDFIVPVLVKIISAISIEYDDETTFGNDDELYRGVRFMNQLMPNGVLSMVDLGGDDPGSYNSQLKQRAVGAENKDFTPGQRDESLLLSRVDAALRVPHNGRPFTITLTPYQCPDYVPGPTVKVAGLGWVPEGSIDPDVLERIRVK